MKVVLLLVLLTYCSLSVYAIYDPIEEAIKQSEPAKLQRIFIGGNVILCLDDKTKYTQLAFEVANRTYDRTQKQFGLADALLVVKGLSKIGLAGGTWFLGRQFFKGDTRLAARALKVLLYTMEGVVAYSGIRDIYASLTGYDHILKHSKALAVEAIINRLELCAAQSAFRLKDSTFK